MKKETPDSLSATLPWKPCIIFSSTLLTTMSPEEDSSIGKTNITLSKTTNRFQSFHGLMADYERLECSAVFSTAGACGLVRRPSAGQAVQKRILHLDVRHSESVDKPPPRPKIRSKASRGLCCFMASRFSNSRTSESRGTEISIPGRIPRRFPGKERLTFLRLLFSG